MCLAILASSNADFSAAIKRSNHMMVDSSVYAVLTRKHRSGFVGSAYLLSRTKTAIAIYFIAVGIFVRG